MTISSSMVNHTYASHSVRVKTNPYQTQNLESQNPNKSRFEQMKEKYKDVFTPLIPYSKENE